MSEGRRRPNPELVKLMARARRQRLELKRRAFDRWWAYEVARIGRMHSPRDPLIDPQAGDEFYAGKQKVKVLRVTPPTPFSAGQVVARYEPGPPHCPKFFTLDEWRKRHGRP